VITIQDGSFLTLHYRLSDPGGVDVVNTFGGPPATLSLGTGQLAPGPSRLLAPGTVPRLVAPGAGRREPADPGPAAVGREPLASGPLAVDERHHHFGHGPPGQ